MVQLALLFFVAAAVARQSDGVAPFESEKVVVKITKVRPKLRLGVPVRIELGTGFCLSLDCALVATNYHVAMLTGLPLKIEGEKVLERYLATSPDDEGAIWNEWLDPTTGHRMKYTPVRDLAIFRLSHPLEKKGMHGISFYPDQLKEGQEVDIYAYPAADNKLIRFQRKLTRVPGSFVQEGQNGLLAFRFEPREGGQSIRLGASGGLVVDRKTQQAVGILLGLAKNAEFAVAAPIWSLAGFVRMVQPEVYAKLFPRDVYRPHAESGDIDKDVDTSAAGINPRPAVGINPRPVVADHYLKHDLKHELNNPILPLPRMSPDTLQRRQEESPDIQQLREKAKVWSMT